MKIGMFPKDIVKIFVPEIARNVSKTSNYLNK